MSNSSSINAQITEIYTDGACSGNPGPGGWGSRIEFSDGQIHELGDFEADSTNNRMEMQAAIAALEYLRHWQQRDRPSRRVHFCEAKRTKSSRFIPPKSTALPTFGACGNALGWFGFGGNGALPCGTTHPTFLIGAWA